MNNTYIVYLLRLSNKKIYTGSTPNLQRRIREHDQGLAQATRKYTPVKLVWYGVFPSRLIARRFERYLKTGSGQAFRNKHLIITSFSKNLSARQYQ